MYFKFIFLIFLIYLENSIQSEIDTFILDQIKDSLNDSSIDQLLDGLKSFIDDQEIIYEQASLKNLLTNEPDYSYGTKEMIEYRGFKYEEYDVVTEDCYILTLHRIVNPNDNTPNKPPVLLSHGLTDTSTEWIRNSIGGMINDTDDRNLGFALAKRGYDVWLGNFRGNKYSHKHTTFSKFNPNYYKFNFDNHGLQDLPAMIGKIQNVTNFDQIEYVGYSQGASAMFVLLSLKPEVASVLSSYIALAPYIFGDTVKSPLRFLTYIPKLIKSLLYLNIPIVTDSFIDNYLFKTFVPFGCRFFNGFFCEQMIYFLSGYSHNQINSTRLPVYWNHIPTGTSLPSIARFSQTVLNGGKFEMLNYMSKEQNMKCYNSPEPIRIPLENIKLKTMYIIYGLTDTLASVSSIKKIKESLTVKAFFKAVDEKNFAHLDFMFSKNIDKLVYEDLIGVLELEKPSKKIKNGLRFKQFTAETCHLPNTNTRCHISDVNSVLNNIF